MTRPRDPGPTPTGAPASPEPARELARDHATADGAATGLGPRAGAEAPPAGEDENPDGDARGLATDSAGDGAVLADGGGAADGAEEALGGERSRGEGPGQAGEDRDATGEDRDGSGEAAVGTRLARRREAERRNRRSFFAELPVLLLVAFVLALLLKTFLVQAFFIPSESMVPTLAVGDRVLVNKLAHDFRDPQRGEVIVFSQEDGVPGAPPSGNPIVRTFQSLASGLGFVQTGEKDFIKRIIGLPGETIEMREGVVYIDGVAVPEQDKTDGGYLSRPDLIDFGPVDIPEGEYFLMGDNRPNSSDSRSLLSTIAEDDIVGRAFAVVWPLNRLSVLSMPDYDADAEVTRAHLPAPGAVAGQARR